MACLTLTAKPSGRNPVFLAPQPSHLSEWKVLPFKPKDRMELEYTPVPVNNIPKIKCEMKIVATITFDTACTLYIGKRKGLHRQREDWPLSLPGAEAHQVVSIQPKTVIK